jgi:Protein of unknown function (DUF1552)
MAFNRRKFLVGLGGAVVGLPFLEGLAARNAHADDAVPPFALFYRRGNGVQQALFDRNPTAEPERWWPQIPYGALTPATLGAATESAIALELSSYASKLAIVRGLRHPVGTQNGHREGFIQGLTGAGVKYPTPEPDTFNCDPLGESLDNRIARELTPASATSMFFSVGGHDQGGVSFLPTVDAQGKQMTRAGEENLLAVYTRIFLPAQQQAGDAVARELLMSRRKSVNDLVRDQLVKLRSDPRLSKSDLDRLQSHTDAIRDVEQTLACLIPDTVRGDVASYQASYDADTNWSKGNTVEKFGATVAALASLSIVCGATRSILINVGEPQDVIAYRNVNGAGDYDFHSISHRQSNDDDPATRIANAQQMHHAIDRFHLQLFRSILDRLSSVVEANGTTLLDRGVCVHYSDIGSGQHEITQLPYLYVGSVGGALATGVYRNEDGQYLVKLLNTIGAAVGCKSATGGPLDDFNAGNNGGIRGRLDSLVTA